MASRLLLSSLLLSGCLIGDSDDKDCTGGKCDGDGSECNDARYGNGTCDLQLECAAPDIDCFDTFESDEAAAEWFAKFETELAKEQGRPPRKFLTSADPRWAKTRALLDRGWEAFKNNRPVGKLRDKRPGLVMLEDPEPNAFVAPSLALDKAGFTVMVQTGLFSTGGSDDGALGVMMHEFQHAIGLHVIGDTRNRLRKFYFASASDEPIGKFQSDDMVARRYAESWRTLTGTTGLFYDANLRALPLGGSLPDTLTAALVQANTVALPDCTAALELVGELKQQVTASFDPLTGKIGAVGASIPSQVDQALLDVKIECFAGFTKDLIAVMATAQNKTPAMIEAEMAPSDVALVKGKHVVEGFSAMMLDHRAKLRQLEADLASKVGKQWDHVRYFSDEEDADDVSVLVLRGAKIDPPYAIGGFLTSFLPAEAQPRCADLLARRIVPPYGHDLNDEHHAFCWRAHHTRQLAEHLEREAPSKSARSQPTSAQMPSFDPPRPLPMRRRLSDHLRY